MHVRLEKSARCTLCVTHAFWRRGFSKALTPPITIVSAIVCVRNGFLAKKGLNIDVSFSGEFPVGRTSAASSVGVYDVVVVLSVLRRSAGGHSSRAVCRDQA